MRRNTITFAILMVFLVGLGGWLAWHAAAPISDTPDLPQVGTAGKTAAPVPRTLNTDGGPSTFPVSASDPESRGVASGGYTTWNYNVLRALFVLALIGFATAGWILGQRRDPTPSA